MRMTRNGTMTSENSTSAWPRVRSSRLRCRDISVVPVVEDDRRLRRDLAARGVGVLAWILSFAPVLRSPSSWTPNPYPCRVVCAAAGVIPMTFGTYMHGVAVGAIDAEADWLALALGAELGAATTAICFVSMSAPV